MQAIRAVGTWERILEKIENTGKGRSSVGGASVLGISNGNSKGGSLKYSTRLSMGRNVE